MKTTKTIIAGCLLAGVLAMVPSARAVLFTDSTYVGYFDPGVPSSLADELGLINYLIDLAPGATGPDQSYGQNLNKTRDYDRTGSTIAVAALPDATGGANLGTTATTVDASGLMYLLAKYGTRSYVWFSATGFSAQETLLTAAPNGNGLSHSDGFNGTTTSVPDASVTMILFGAGLLGVGALRRRLSK